MKAPPTKNFSNSLRHNFSLGKFDETLKQLSPFLKNYSSYSEEDQCIVIATLINLNLSNKALALLSKEYNQKHSTALTQYFLKKQIMYAQLKISFQSLKMGKELLKKTILYIEEIRENCSIEVLKSLYTQIATNLRTINEYKMIQELDSSYPWTNEICVTDCLFRLELIRAKVTFNNILSNDVLNELNLMLEKFSHHKSFCIVIKMHIIDLKVLYGELSAPEADNIESYLNISQTPPTFRSYYYFLIGMVKLQVKCKEKSVEYLNKALLFCDSVNLKQSILYWKNKIEPMRIHDESSLLLACGKTFSLESYLWGNRFSVPNFPLPPIYEREFATISAPTEEQCWIIDKNKIESDNYYKIQHNNKTLDLYSGILFSNNTITLFTDLRAKLLTLIISSEKSGAHRLYLIDELFGDGFYYYNSAILRLKNLIVELNKIGIKIKRKNNHYFYDFERNEFIIIFPLDHKHRGPISYLKKIKSTVTRNIIVEKLNLKPSTASLYLKKWKEQGIIIKSEHLKPGEFHIVISNIDQKAINDKVNI